MDILRLTFFIFFFIRTLRNTIYHLFWWYLKEYRFDRMLAHLRETYQGKRWMFGRLSILKWAVLIGIIGGIGEIGKWAIFSIYLLEGGLNIFELKRGWKMPPLRPKVAVLFLVVFLLQILFLNFLSPNPFLNALITDKLLGPTVAFLVFLINILFYFYRKWIVRRARLKMKGCQNLVVVGITGSFGKTTTKEFIAQILSKKFKVLKTIGSQNTDIGVAEVILKNDLSNLDIFVCEMAAYKKGEIRKICSIVKPCLKIAVISGINEQHQSLFGSLQNTMKAKFELVEALPKDGVAIFSGGNKYCLKLADWSRKKSLKVKVVKEKLKKRRTNLSGEHILENVVLAAEVAKELGMGDKEISKMVKKLKLPPKTMNLIKKGAVTLIDDTFNANPAGVLSALKFLKNYRGRKVLILQPLIELGEYAVKIHEKIGEKAAHVCDEIILTNKNFYEEFTKGVKKVLKDKEKVKIGGKLSLTERGVILFEGKEAEKYLKKLIK